MKLSQVKSILTQLETINFQLPNGTLVPKHFHVTEVGKTIKHFIDCGGTVRTETRINFQLWHANDLDHRLAPLKLLNIIELSESVLQLENEDIEVEFQGQTIQKFGLDFNGENFVLTNKQTDCLAKDKCGIPAEKQKVKLAELNNEPCCTQDGNCC